MIYGEIMITVSLRFYCPYCCEEYLKLKFKCSRHDLAKLLSKISSVSLESDRTPLIFRDERENHLELVIACPHYECEESLMLKARLDRDFFKAKFKVVIDDMVDEAILTIDELKALNSKGALIDWEKGIIYISRG